MSEITLTSENFDEKVLKADKPILVDFWAVWCGPCKMMAPIVSEIAEENADKMYVGKLNVDEEMELARKYRVASIPTLIVFEKGREVRRSVGVIEKEDILELLGL